MLKSQQIHSVYIVYSLFATLVQWLLPLSATLNLNLHLHLHLHLHSLTPPPHPHAKLPYSTCSNVTNSQQDKAMVSSHEVPRSSKTGLRAFLRFLICVIVIKVSIERKLRQVREERERAMRRSGVVQSAPASRRRWWGRWESLTVA